MLKSRMFVVRLCLAFAGLLGSAADLAAQEGRLPGREAAELYQETIDLIEATALVSPELSRAGAPLLENVRQAAESLRSGRTREHTGLMYRLLLNARLYLQMSDAVAKPPDFAEDIRRQLGQLRNTVDRIDAHFRASLDAREDIARGPDRDNLERYGEENRALSARATDGNRVVFLGDSITDGWQLNQYFPGRFVVNRGISGQITSEMLARMKADVIDLQPAALVVLAGTNDLARGVPLKTIQDNLTMIADLAVAHSIRPVFASVLPIHDHNRDKDPSYLRSELRPPDQIVALNQWIHKMCEARQFIYLDYHSAMVDQSGSLRRELAEDGLHPNGEGYKVMTPLAEAAMEKALAAPPPKPRKKLFGLF